MHRIREEIGQTIKSIATNDCHVIKRELGTHLAALLIMVRERLHREPIANPSAPEPAYLSMETLRNSSWFCQEISTELRNVLKSHSLRISSNPSVWADGGIGQFDCCFYSGTKGSDIELALRERVNNLREIVRVGKRFYWKYPNKLD